MKNIKDECEKTQAVEGPSKRNNTNYLGKKPG